MTSGTSVVPFVKKSSILPAVDCNNYSLPPLDYSYLKLVNLTDIYDEEPRPYLLQKKAPVPDNKDQKSSSRCLRLNNNDFAELTILPEIISNLFIEPSVLGWLDLSFNALAKIDQILCQFTELEILNLHGNQISNINEVDKLHCLTNLRKLTLHGNTIETVKNYRNYVLAMIPWLQNIDFSAVTKADRATAETWEKMNKTPKKKKREA